MRFTSVTGTWTQVAATCRRGRASSAAFWVGLGGYDSAAALEQIGTESDCASSGVASYYAWYELVPERVVNLSLKIDPGDTITTSVNVSGNTVLLQLKNRTRGTVFTKRATKGVLDLRSAEWIVEAPSACSGGQVCPVPLANFGSVTFSRIAAIADGDPGTLTNPFWVVSPLELVPHKHLAGLPGRRDLGVVDSKAGTCLPTPVGFDGTAFELSWVAVARVSTC